MQNSQCNWKEVVDWSIKRGWYFGQHSKVGLHFTELDRQTDTELKTRNCISVGLDCFMERGCWRRVTCQGTVSGLTRRRVCKGVPCGVAVQRTRGALRLWKRDRWYRRVNVQAQNPAYSGFLHKASILLRHTQPPASSCTQMHIPPQLLPLLCLPGNSNALSGCHLMLWHNVACNGWPELGLLVTLLTVSPLCIWCNIRVFSGSTGGGTELQAIFFFFLNSSFCFCSVEWLIKKSPCALFSLHPRPGQYESSPAERRTKGHTCDTLRPFGIWVRIVNCSSKSGFH